MITLMILSVLAGVAAVIFLFSGKDDGASACVSWLCFILLLVLSCISTAVSFSTGTKGYEEIDTYLYVTEDGSTASIDGPFYYKDGCYYTKQMGRSAWVPFAPCDLVPADLPESNTTKNDSTTTTHCPSCGYSCTTPYCGQCGAEIP